MDCSCPSGECACMKNSVVFKVVANKYSCPATDCAIENFPFAECGFPFKTWVEGN